MRYKVDCVQVHEGTTADGTAWFADIAELPDHGLANLIENLQGEQKRREHEAALRKQAERIAHTQRVKAFGATDPMLSAPTHAWVINAIVEALKIDPNR